MSVGYVGSEVVYSTTATLTITAADLPAGTAPGDVILVTACWLGADAGGSGANTTTPGWDQPYPATGNTFSPGTYWAVAPFSGRYDLSSLPLTINLTGPVTTGSVYTRPRAIVTTVTPGRVIFDAEVGGSFRHESRGPERWSHTLDQSADGIVIAALITNDFTGTALLTTIETAGVAAGWTEVDDQTWSLGRGNFKVGIADAGRGATMARWLSTGSGSLYAPIVASAWGLTDPIPLPVLTHTGAMTT